MIGAYIYGFQLERGLAATDYLESGATTGKAGVLEDLPRINYSGSTPSLLLEPSRTNILEFSEYFEDSFYIKDSGVTATSNQVISPEGINNGSLISVQSNGRLYANHTSGTYISSVFIKAGTFSHFKIMSQNVDLTTSPISVGSLDLKIMVTDGIEYTAAIQVIEDFKYKPIPIILTHHTQIAVITISMAHN